MFSITRAQSLRDSANERKTNRRTTKGKRERLTVAKQQQQKKRGRKMKWNDFQDFKSRVSNSFHFMMMNFSMRETWMEVFREQQRVCSLNGAQRKKRWKIDNCLQFIRAKRWQLSVDRASKEVPSGQHRSTREQRARAIEEMMCFFFLQTLQRNSLTWSSTAVRSGDD